MDFAALHAQAHAAGMAAGMAAIPTPMIVNGYEPVTEGVCGFAWIAMPGNIGFSRWTKAQGISHKGYPSGQHVWVRGFGQSLTRKEAYASAYAQVLRDAGVERVYAQSRMD